MKMLAWMILLAVAVWLSYAVAWWIFLLMLPLTWLWMIFD